MKEKTHLKKTKINLRNEGLDFACRKTCEAIWEDIQEFNSKNQRGDLRDQFLEELLKEGRK